MGTKITKLVAEKKIGKYKDAKTPLYIDVTAIDVARAKCFAPDECAMAKATCRVIPNTLKTFFYRHGAYVATMDPATGKKTTWRYIPSAKARKNIEEFDKTGKFVPGRYRLDPPSGSNTLQALRARSKKRPGRHQPGNTKITRRPTEVKVKGRLQYAFAY